MAGGIAIEERADSILQKAKTCEVCKKIPSGFLFMIPEDCGGYDKWHKICEECAKQLTPRMR
jgi:hypothetical protein